jgi:hypothetical protein
MQKAIVNAGATAHTASRGDLNKSRAIGASTWRTSEMDQKSKLVEDKVLDRRSTLKALFGLAAVAVGAAVIMAPGAAEAAPVTPTPAPKPAAKDAEAGRDADLPSAEPTQYYYRRRVYRRRYIYRPRRRVYYRRRYVRRVYW